MKRLISAVFGNWRRTLVAIFIIALVVRVVFVSTLQEGFYFPDSIAYSGAAVSLITNGELGQYNRPPGYPVYLAAIYTLFGESVLATRMVESLVGAFLAVVIALIARRIGGDVVGALAGLLWSIYPMGVFIAGLVYPENLLTMLFACGVLCFLPYSHQELSPKRVFFAGILWGLAALTKPIVLATLGAVSLWLMCQSGRKRLLLVSLLFLGSAATVVPWIIRDFYVYGRLVVIEPRVVEHLPRVAATKQSGADGKRESILKHPRLLASRFSREFFAFWNLYPNRMAMDWPSFREGQHRQDARVVKDTIFSGNRLTIAVGTLSTGPIFFFALIGTAAMWFKHERRRNLALLWLMILSFAVVYSFFYAKTRYRIPIEPYIIILSAYGIFKSWGAMTWALGKFEGQSSKKLSAQDQELTKSSTFKPIIDSTLKKG